MATIVHTVCFMLDAVIIVQIWCYSILLLSFKERTEFSYEDSKKNEKENFKEIKENGHTIRGLYHLVVSGKVISFVISPNAQFRPRIAGTM